LSIQIKASREKFMKKFIKKDEVSEAFYIIAVEDEREKIRSIYEENTCIHDHMIRPMGCLSSS